jgi:hypothetical protein
MTVELKWKDSVSTIQDESGQWLIYWKDDKLVLWDCFSARERMSGTLDECKAFAASDTKSPSKMEGQQVSEEHVAKALGFKDVYEMRRWDTDLGKENEELKHKLKKATEEAERFRWHGMRGAAILQRCLEFIENKGKISKTKLSLAIRVLNGESGAVDWDHELDDWLAYLDPLRIKIEGEECVVTGLLDGSKHAKTVLEIYLATFKGPKLRVKADHVGLVQDGLRAWIANVPETCRITYANSQLGKCVYHSYLSSETPCQTADFENVENWQLAELIPAYSCMVKPPPENV